MVVGSELHKMSRGLPFHSKVLLSEMKKQEYYAVLRPEKFLGDLGEFRWIQESVLLLIEQALDSSQEIVSSTDVNEGSIRDL